ncbi:hypothetical protein KSF78_0002844 [Schistosoma japonicum]|nr:hypothetical protein KSF78_0002844 [Schistosoma japonicum]KAH8863972.1 hypothetical protein KSF78_0002844 [Schistosoma japonicum]
MQFIFVCGGGRITCIARNLQIMTSFSIIIGVCCSQIKAEQLLI